MLPLTSSYRYQLRGSLPAPESLLGLQIFSMNVRARRGEQRARLQALPGLEQRLGTGAGTAPLETGAAGCLLRGVGQGVLFGTRGLQALGAAPEHPWRSGYGGCSGQRRGQSLFQGYADRGGSGDKKHGSADPACEPFVSCYVCVQGSEVGAWVLCTRARQQGNWFLLDVAQTFYWF